MKKFIIFIIKSLLRLIFFVAAMFIVYIVTFSLKNKISFADTLLHFKAISSELVNSILHDNNSTYTASNSDTQINIVDISSSTANTYYYNQLDDLSKTIYNEFYKNIDNLKKDNFTVDFGTQFNDLLHTSTGELRLNKSFQSALDAFFYDHPEIFYIDLSKISLTITSSSIGPFITYTVKLVPKDSTNYLIDTLNSSTDVDVAISKIENTRDSLINNIKDQSTTYKKILKIHDILANSLEYNTSSTATKNSHNIYGALIDGTVVCDGYAKTLKYMLDTLGIESILVRGTAINSQGKSESHMWNYINMEDSWYGIDLTWNDPIIVGGSSKNNVRHDYFLKGKYTFYTSHSPSGKISDTGMLFKLPTLSSENYKN